MGKFGKDIDPMVGVRFGEGQDPTRGGRKPSIKKQLQELLQANGEITIPKKDVIRVYKNGNVKLKLPTEMQLAMKLNSWALSQRGTDSIKALQLIIESIDGKGIQPVELNAKGMDSSMAKVTMVIKERKLDENQE